MGLLGNSLGKKECFQISLLLVTVIAFVVSIFASEKIIAAFTKDVNNTWIVLSVYILIPLAILTIFRSLLSFTLRVLFGRE